jgi:micrococcal nuclease
VQRLEEVGQAASVPRVEAHGADAVVLPPDAEHGDTRLGVPGDAQRLAAVVDEQRAHAARLSGCTDRGGLSHAAAKMGAVSRCRAVVVAVLLLGAAACGRTGADGPPAAGPGAARVTRVVDGDTVRVSLAGTEEPVRLIGIDTPETHGAGGLRECFGAEATRRMADLLPPGTPVRLVRDVEARDRYDRLLAYVYRSTDDLFVNLAMAREGYATTLTYPPNVAHADEFVAAVRAARNDGRGLWSRCGGPDVALRPDATAPGRR